METALKNSQQIHPDYVNLITNPEAHLSLENVRKRLGELSVLEIKKAALDALKSGGITPLREATASANPILDVEMRRIFNQIAKLVEELRRGDPKTIVERKHSPDFKRSEDDELYYPQLDFHLHKSHLAKEPFVKAAASNRFFARTCDVAPGEIDVIEIVDQMMKDFREIDESVSSGSFDDGKGLALVQAFTHPSLQSKQGSAALASSDYYEVMRDVLRNNSTRHYMMNNDSRLLVRVNPFIARRSGYPMAMLAKFPARECSSLRHLYFDPKHHAGIQFDGPRPRHRTIQNFC